MTANVLAFRRATERVRPDDPCCPWCRSQVSHGEADCIVVYAHPTCARRIREREQPIDHLEGVLAVLGAAGLAWIAIAGVVAPAIRWALG